jgi:hypothetical protein
MYKRMNPICGKPLVRIKNTGSSTLTSLTITYGIVGGTPSSYTWTGSLPFLKSADVELPSFSVSSAGTDKRFYAMVGAPNGGTDQYPDNNRMETPYVAPARFSGYIVFELKTNNYGYETSYEVKDAGGSLLLSRSGLGNNITYRDTLNLGDGCYEFRLKDTGEDGLSWWANTAQGNGYMRIKRASDGSMIRAYNPDFGAEIFEQFTVDNTVSISSPEFTERVNIYPNPSTGIVNVDITFPGPLPAEIKITNLLGETVCLAKKEQNTVHELELNLSGNPAGIYFVEVRTPERSILRKIILEKQGM